MSHLFISSTGDQAGQSLVAWSIARRLLEMKIRPAFFKPSGTGLLRTDGIWTDPDALLFKNVLNIDEPLEMICPFLTSEKGAQQDGKIITLEEIKAFVSGLLKGREILLIAGCRHIFFDDVSHSPPDITIIKALNADLVLAHRYRQTSTTLYSILSVNSLVKEKVKGVVINRVPTDQVNDVKEQVLPALNKNGISNVTVLPEDPFLSMRSLEEIREILNGETICGEEYLDRSVEGMTVGTTGLNEELRLFKRVYNKIILLEPSTTARRIAGILLTGDREPPDKVLEVAEKSKIPLILVKEDSFVVQERLEGNLALLSSGDEKKILHFMKMLDGDDFLNRLIQSLNIIS
ncbi:AAA family ATPase [Deltaproteobacteria bacterium]|nr:AAA family ATPase [Deltaproteobacteria bacterium]